MYFILTPSNFGIIISWINFGPAVANLYKGILPFLISIVTASLLFKYLRALSIALFKSDAETIRGFKFILPKTNSYLVIGISSLENSEIKPKKMKKMKNQYSLNEKIYSQTTSQLKVISSDPELLSEFKKFKSNFLKFKLLLGY